MAAVRGCLLSLLVLLCVAPASGGGDSAQAVLASRDADAADALRALDAAANAAGTAAGSVDAAAGAAAGAAAVANAGAAAGTSSAAAAAGAAGAAGGRAGFDFHALSSAASKAASGAGAAAGATQRLGSAAGALGGGGGGPSMLGRLGSLMYAAASMVERAAGAGVGGSASEKEACFTCRYLLRVAYAAAGGRHASDAELMSALVSACMDAPPVSAQGCATLVELKKEIAATLGKSNNFNGVCDDIQLCWAGLMWVA